MSGQINGWGELTNIRKANEADGFRPYEALVNYVRRSKVSLDFRNFPFGNNVLRERPGTRHVEHETAAACHLGSVFCSRIDRPQASVKAQTNYVDRGYGCQTQFALRPGIDRDHEERSWSTSTRRIHR